MNRTKTILLRNIILGNILSHISLVLTFLHIPPSLENKFVYPRNLKPLVIAFEILGWSDIIIVKGNISDELGSESVRSMRNYYGAEIEIAELRSSFSGSFIETPPDSTLMHSSNRKFHFICFADSNEFLLLHAKITNLQLHSVLIVVPFNKTGVSEDETFSKWSSILSEFPLNVDSEIYFSVQHNSSETLTIYEYYKICKECLPIQQLVCNWDTESSKSKTDCITDKYQRRKDLNETFINVIGVDVTPFYASLRLGEHNESQINGGMLAELFVSIARDLNFTYSLQILNGYKYGSFQNGSWNGMIGSLSRNEVDMTVSEISMASDRLSFIDFTMSFDNLGRKIYIRRTRQDKKINWSFFSSPFSPYLHASVALCVVMLTVFFWSFVKFWHFNEQRNKLSLAESSWLILSCFCQKGAYFIPKGLSVKILFIVTSFTSLILFSCYSATLISQLSVVPPVKLPFNDLAGLVQTRGFLGGPIKNDLSHIYMEKTCPEILSISTLGSNIQCQLLTQMWAKIVRRDVTNLPSSFEEGLKKVLKGKFAFLSSSTGTRYRINNLLSEKDSCLIHEMDGDYISSNLAFGLRKRNPYKSIINYKLLKLWQSGTIKRLKSIWIPQRKICIVPSFYKDVSVYDIAVAPLALFFGHLLSSCMFILERFLCVRKYNKEPIFMVKYLGK